MPRAAAPAASAAAQSQQPLLPSSSVQHTLPNTAEQSVRRTERRAACIAVAFVVMFVVSAILFATNKTAVAEWFSRVGDALARLPVPLTILLLGVVVLLSSGIPGPIHGPLLLLSGYVLGFEVAFITMYPFHVLGDLCVFALARRCCAATASRVVARRTKLATLAGAVQHGGLKLVLLIKFTPAPPVVTSGALATFGAPVWQFVVATLIECLPKTAMPTFVGSSAKSLVAAIAGTDASVPSGGGEDGSGSDAADGTSSSTVANHLNLALMVSGVAATVISVCLIAAYTRRELQRITAATTAARGSASMATCTVVRR